MYFRFEKLFDSFRQVVKATSKQPAKIKKNHAIIRSNLHVGAKPAKVHCGISTGFNVNKFCPTPIIS